MTSDSSRTAALILAGGAGTRFWPASRHLRPKQLLPLAGDEALIAQTIERVLPLCGADPQSILVATGEHLKDATRASLAALGGDAFTFLIEPKPRNTAPCIAWAAATVARTDPDAVMMVLPSDSYIADVRAFREVLTTAIASARRGVITTVGITPTHPETGFGYIELAAKPERGQANEVLRFVEKPNLEKAKEFLAAGRYLWNAGMFFFRVRDMLRAVREHMPALAEGLDAIDAAAKEGREAEAIEKIFPTLPSVSIDFGVMEHEKALAVVPGSFGWSDVGSFLSAWELASKDEHGNAAPASSVILGGRNNLVVDLRSDAAAKKRVIALAHVEDLVVVETDDALLVIPRERAQDVKDIVAALKAADRSELV